MIKIPLYTFNRNYTLIRQDRVCDFPATFKSPKTVIKSNAVADNLTTEDPRIAKILET